jgi:transporter family protein
VAAWFGFALVVLISWGVVGLLQKLSTNHLSGESATIWLIVGFVLFQPLVYPGKMVFSCPARGMTLGMLSGFVNALGGWALLAGLRSGGKASVVSPLTALYPLVVVFVAPFILHESISATQAVGVVFALIAVSLLSSS